MGRPTETAKTRRACSSFNWLYITAAACVPRRAEPHVRTHEQRVTGARTQGTLLLPCPPPPPIYSFAAPVKDMIVAAVLRAVATVSKRVFGGGATMVCTEVALFAHLHPRFVTGVSPAVS